MTWSSRCLLWVIFSTAIAAGICHIGIRPEVHTFLQITSGIFAFVLLLSATVALHISLVPCSETHTLSSLLFSYFNYQKRAFRVRSHLAKMKKLWIDPRNAQEELLRQLITRDAGTEYGRDNRLGDINSLEELRKKHPITKYSHYQEYIRRLADGEENVFVGEKLLRFGITSGTTGAGKLIPVVASQPNIVDLVMFRSWHCHGYKTFGAPSPVQKHCLLYCKPSPLLSKSGLPVAPVVYLPEAARKSLSVYTTPFDGFKIMTDFEATYVNMLFGILDKNICTFTAPFLSQVYRGFKLLEDHWPTMLADITDGSINKDLDIDDDIRKALNAALKPMPARAAELRSEFAKGFEGIMNRMWPNIKLINSIDIAGFQRKLESGYTKGTPVYSSGYGCTESTIALCVHPRLKQYVLLPEEVVYEFIPEDNCSEEQPSTLLIDEVELGKKYELLMTTKSGFYRFRFGDVVEVVGFHENCPVIEVKYRTGELLNLRSEKIDVGVATTAVEETVTHWPEAKLVDWTCAESPLLYAESKKDSYDMFYILFIELETANNNTITEEQKDKFDDVLRSHHGFYEHYRQIGTISKPRLVIVRPDSFKELKDFILSNSTASFNQFKMPRKLHTKTLLDFMLNREV